MPTGKHGLQDDNCLRVVLKNTLCNNMMRHKRWAEAEGSFNVHTCYDRLVHNYGSILW